MQHVVSRASRDVKSKTSPNTGVSSKPRYHDLQIDISRPSAQFQLFPWALSFNRAELYLPGMPHTWIN